MAKEKFSHSEYNFARNILPDALQSERERVTYGSIEYYLLGTEEMKKVVDYDGNQVYCSNNGAVILHTERISSTRPENHIRALSAIFHPFNLDSKSRILAEFRDIVDRVNQLDEQTLSGLSALGLKRFPNPADTEVELGEED